MFWRALRSVAIAAGATMLVGYLPDIARWFRMREM